MDQRIAQQINYKTIQASLQKLGFVFFDTGRYNLNIVGVRSCETRSNSFDDFIVVCYRDNSGNPVWQRFAATTDPGLYWLKNPMKVDGTAILIAPQQVRGAFAMGLHNGKYEALRQVKPFKFVRDNNKDERLDFYSGNEDLYAGKVQQGIIGANLHRASEWREVEEVGKYSAACQVVKSPADYDHFMQLCRHSKELYGNSFTYTLINEDNLVL